WFGGNERKHLANLIESVPQQEVRVPPVALGPQNKEVRLRILERVRPLGRHGKTVRAGIFAERRRQVYRAERGVALMNLQLSIQPCIRRVADVGDDTLH